jgi:hypothetical protein
MGRRGSGKQQVAETVHGWVPPAYGECDCDGHIEDVLELRIPLAAGDGAESDDVAVWALLTSGGLATVPLAEERRHLTNGVSIERQGPFHWKVLAGERFTPFVAGGELTLLEDAVAGQSGVERAMWIGRQGALVVGAPGLCANGVQCAVVQALRSAYVRRSLTSPARTA